MGKGKLHPNILTNLIGQSVILSFFPDFDGSVQRKMPLYRTVSDRGLWKKYKRDSVQHFHKPQYLEKTKNEPQVRKINLCIKLASSFFCRKGAYIYDVHGRWSMVGVLKNQIT